MTRAAWNRLWTSLWRAARALHRDRRGVTTVQTLILTGALALAGTVGVKILSASLGARSVCAGEEIQTLGGTSPCTDNGEPGVPTAVTEPPQPPADQPADDDQGDDGSEQPAAGGDQDQGGGDDGGDQPEEVDPKKELLDLLADLIGLTDAIKCVTEGDILACAFTVLNFTPGKIFGLGFKLITKANKIRKAVSKFLAAAGKARKAEEEARKAEKAAREAEKAAGACKGGKCDAPGVCCAPGTLVETDAGQVPIEELEVGDQVLSRDDRTGEQDYRPVVRTMVTADQPLLAVELEDESGADETIEVTPPHPFQVEGRGWVSAGDLAPGDEVLDADGGLLQVDGVISTGRTTTVYNLEVAEYHTYFVGHGGAWVHNECLPQALRNKLKRVKNEIAAGGNRGISGAVSPGDARKLGEAFVGPGFRTANDGKVLISADGLRQFRLPSPKRGINPNTGEPFSRTGTQVNFEQRPTAGGPFTSNVHLDVTN